MTDKELQDFIKHGETGFVEFAMVFGDGWARHAIEIAKALRARISQCERCGEVNPAEIHTCSPQEPLWIRNREGKLELHAPPQREWQGLTEDEVAQAMYRADAIFTGPMQFKFAKEIEAALKAKNA